MFSPSQAEGVKHASSIHDWDTNNTGFISNQDAVHAVYNLEKEIAGIDERYENGELNSFGKSERVVLQRFQELRRRQVELSRRQVDLLSSKKTKARQGIDQGGLGQLTMDMQKLCAMIEEVEKMTAGGSAPTDEQEGDGRQEDITVAKRESDSSDE